MGKHSPVVGSTLLFMILLSSCAVTTLASKLRFPSKISWRGHVLPPEPYKGYYDFLKQCAKVLTDQCGDEMGKYLFYTRVKMSYVCCHNLKKMGKDCHDQLARTLSRMDDFKKHKAQILRRSKQAWTQCSFIDKCVAKDE